MIFNHNDVLSANFLDNGDKIWLIDRDYGGFNGLLFDLDWLASDNELSCKQAYCHLEVYFEIPIIDESHWRYNAMKFASMLWKTMWSILSEICSQHGFDFVAHTLENLNRIEPGWNDFDQLCPIRKSLTKTE